MKKIAIVLLIALLSGLCAGAFAEDKPFAGTELVVYNWYDYIDPTVLEMFEDETGINITYVNFTQNEDMYARLEAGAGTYDVVFPSEYMIERLIKEDRLETLNPDNIPNLANVLDNLLDPSYDPGNAHSVPYMWGTLGILYNEDMVSEPITSWTSLFDPQYKGNIFMMNSLRDTIGLALKTLGYSVNTRDEKELQEAGAMLVQQRRDKLIAGNFVDETKDKMVSGEAALAVIYSGDALYAMEKNDKLKYVVPMEGSNIWVDGMCIPKGSAHKEAAECFINFMCRPDIAQMNMDYIFYSSPIRQVVENLDEENAANEALNPPEDVVARCEYYNDISDSMSLYEGIWMEIQMAR
ncbi:MAG: ABC transporter substrate-binding protein [bacterium]